MPLAGRDTAESTEGPWPVGVGAERCPCHPAAALPGPCVSTRQRMAGAPRHDWQQDRETPAGAAALQRVPGLVLRGPGKPYQSGGQVAPESRASRLSTGTRWPAARPHRRHPVAQRPPGPRPRPSARPVPGVARARPCSWVQGAGCRVQGPGCRVPGAGSQVRGTGCRVPRVHGRAPGAPSPRGETPEREKHWDIFPRGRQAGARCLGFNEQPRGLPDSRGTWSLLWRLRGQGLGKGHVGSTPREHG